MEREREGERVCRSSATKVNLLLIQKLAFMQIFLLVANSSEIILATFYM